MTSSQPKKVLLVDDEPNLIAALRRRLSLEFSIVTANSGPQALEMIAGDPDIAVIVADMTVPGLPLVHVNPAFEDLTGYAPAEALGQTFNPFQKAASKCTE